jgi:hypothetical protein
VDFFATLDDAAKSRGLPYLIIGGYAVIAHGFARLTFDFDIAVERARQADWIECTRSMGYSVAHDGGAFLQLIADKQLLPLDLMLLNPSTFAKLSSAAVQKKIAGRSFPVVSLLHLLALKVHALNHTRTRRFLKDFEDITELVSRNKIDLESPELREIFQKYGTTELYDKVRRACEQQ